MWKFIIILIVVITVTGTVGYMWVKSECHRYSINQLYPVETCGKYLKDSNCLENLPDYISQSCQVRLKGDDGF